MILLNDSVISYFLGIQFSEFSMLSKSLNLKSLKAENRVKKGRNG